MNSEQKLEAILRLLEARVQELRDQAGNCAFGSDERQLVKTEQAEALHLLDEVRKIVKG